MTPNEKRFLFSLASARLRELDAERKTIFGLFPQLKITHGNVTDVQPKPKAQRKQHRRFHKSHKPHWTQMPENQARLKEAHEKAIRTRMERLKKTA